MPFSEVTGTATVGTTERSLYTNTNGVGSANVTCVAQLFLDIANMTGTEIYEVRVYEKVISAGPQRVVETISVRPDGSSVLVLPPLHLRNGWDFTLKKVAGTDRSFTWSIRMLT